MVTCIQTNRIHAATNDGTAANVLIHHTMQMNEQVNYAFRIVFRFGRRGLPTSIWSLVPLLLLILSPVPVTSFIDADVEQSSYSLSFASHRFRTKLSDETRIYASR